MRRNKQTKLTNGRDPLYCGVREGPWLVLGSRLPPLVGIIGAGRRLRVSKKHEGSIICKIDVKSGRGPTRRPGLLGRMFYYQLSLVPTELGTYNYFSNPSA